MDVTKRTVTNILGTDENIRKYQERFLKSKGYKISGLKILDDEHLNTLYKQER